VVLERLPLTPNGKLDRRALPAPEVVPSPGRRGPRTPQEEVLCGIFADVLGVEKVGIDDSFFELGGDSIVSIQLVSRARQAGVSITPRAVFQHQTVAALAEFAGSLTASPPSGEAAPDRAVGAVSATPIMRWLKARGGPIEGFHQGLLLQLPVGVGEADLTAALQAVLDHHDALRLRLTGSGSDGAWSDGAWSDGAWSDGAWSDGAWSDGGWDLAVAPVGAVQALACLRRIDIGGLGDEAGLRACIGSAARSAAERLSPADGVMVQAVWFDAGARRPGRLLLTIHHLAVDGVSWRILVPDLAAAWSALAAGGAVSLPPRGTSFRGWSQRLLSHAQRPQVEAELSYWTAMLGQPSLSLVGGALDAGRDVFGAAAHVTLTLPCDATQALLSRVPARFHGGINEVLLTGLAVAVCDWHRRRAGAGGAPGGQAVVVDVEGHGREEVIAGVDLSRTVGWFTSLFPLRLDLGALDVADAAAGGPALGRALKAVKEQLRAVPEKGLGYGLLRYLNGRTAAALSGFAAAQLGFNYLGRFAGGDGTAWSAAAEAVALGGEDPAMPLAHGIEVNALTLDGPGGAELVARWSYAPGLVSAAEVGDLAQRWFAVLEALVRHAAQPGSGGRSPSDLALVGLTQDEIERLERQYPRLEDVLPLSPLQEGLLFHALYDARAPDVYTVQLELELEGSLDGAALEAAMRALLARHDSLRACFWQEGLSRAVQVIVPDALPPWRMLDLSSLDETEQAARLDRVVEEERLGRFDLAAAPLMRLALVRLGAQRHRLVLSNHHLLMDGWSAPVVVRELLALYARQCGEAADAAEAPPPPPYR
jgi:non-ribosomal peptide synthase protein (TIGR01720 family)